jgi:cyanophycin synthetase
MEFRKVLALRGPNVWASFPVLEAWVDLGSYKDTASDELPGFNDRLTSWLPTLSEHRCNLGTPGGFLERLRRGTYLAHILEHVVLELQCLAGTEVGYGRARETDTAGLYRVAVEYDDEDLGRACLATGRELLLAAVQDTPFSVGEAIAKLRELARRVAPSPALAAVLRAARARDIPVRKLSAEGLLQLGQGSKQRRTLPLQTDRTGAIAESIARDHELSRTLLGTIGVPVPHSRRVADAPAAWTTAQEIGLPVTIRRRFGLEPSAIFRNLTTQEEIERAYTSAAADGYSVLVERAAPGAEWRLLVVGDSVVAATPREGTAAAATPVHPEIAARAVEAANTVGLEVAGIDIIAADITRPLEEQGGVVAAVDPWPDPAIHIAANPETSRPIGQAVLARMFPEDQTGRIPIAAVTGVNGKTTTTRLLAHIAGRVYRGVGMTCTEGIYLNNRRIESGDCSGPRSAATVLQNSRVDVAVLETARGGILRAGLGFDRCDVAVVTNIAEGDHLGLNGIETLEQLARVKRCVVEAVAAHGSAVLKADDPHVEAMAEHCPGSVIFFARDGGHPVLVRHREKKGRVAFVRDRHLILAEGEQEIPLAVVDRIPLTHGGRIPFQVENALAAAAAAWCLGIPCEAIRVGLETFASDLDSAPARFNLLEVRGGAVILDYGHNISSLQSMIEALNEFPHPRRVAVYSAAGDRRDCEMVRQGEMLGGAFDRVILFEEQNCIRGRKAGEIYRLFREGLSRGGRVRAIEEVDGAVKAAEAAIATIKPGEVVLIQVDLVDETIDLARHLAAVGEAREIDLREAEVEVSRELDPVGV